MRNQGRIKIVNKYFYFRYFVSLDRLVLDLNVFTSKAPMSDTFYCQVRYQFDNIDVGIQMSVWVSLKFVKQTVFQKTI